MGAALQLSPEEVDRLEALAARTGRPAEVLRREAIERYAVQLEEELQDRLSFERGRADLEAGRALDHDAFTAWLKTWGTNREGPPPV